MAGEEILPIVFVAVIVIVIAGFVIYARRYKRVPPNQAMVVFGRRRKDIGFEVIQGGGKFVYPIVEQVAYLDLSLQTLEIHVPAVITHSGVPLTVECVAQIKISNEKTKLNVASVQLLGKTREGVGQLAEATIIGQVRGVCATLEVEQINADRETLASKIREVAVPELGNMGLEIISLQVKDISDTQGYLEALGKRRTAEVQRDARVGQANATRDAVIGESAARMEAIQKSADYDKQGQQARFEADAAIAAAQRERDVKVNQYQAQVEIERANKEIAFDLQDRVRRQELVQAEVNIQIKEKERQIDLQQKEIERKTKEVEATIRVPAKAEADRAATIAEGDQRATVLRANGEASATFARGKAQADVIQVQGEANANIIRVTGVADGDKTRAVGLAEADIIKAKGLSEAAAIEATGTATAAAMMKKAEAWSRYQDAAKLQVVVEGLPSIVREMAQPLAGTDKLIMMGGAGGPAGLVENVAQGAMKASAMLESMTGVSLGQLVRGVASGGGGSLGRLASLATDAGIDVSKLQNVLSKLSDDEVKNILRNLSAAGSLVEDSEEKGKGRK
jgi:flotillin